MVCLVFRVVEVFGRARDKSRTSEHVRNVENGSFTLGKRRSRTTPRESTRRRKFARLCGKFSLRRRQTKTTWAKPSWTERPPSSSTTTSEEERPRINRASCCRPQLRCRPPRECCFFIDRRGSKIEYIHRCGDSSNTRWSNHSPATLFRHSHCATQV